MQLSNGWLSKFEKANKLKRDISRSKISDFDLNLDYAASSNAQIKLTISKEWLLRFNS